MENEMQGVLYSESEWRRCWISSMNDGGWIVGELQAESGLNYIINADNYGQIIVHEGLVGWI